MVVGQVGDTVTIEGSVAPLINTAEPTEGATLDSKRIKELPINGRNINTLIEDVTPGVEGINDVNGGVRIGGLMVYWTNYVQDGATTNNIENSEVPALFRDWNPSAKCGSKQALRRPGTPRRLRSSSRPKAAETRFTARSTKRIGITLSAWLARGRTCSSAVRSTGAETDPQ